jgi:UDP-N-acetyl-D-glucosamine dehydrogenase
MSTKECLTCSGKLEKAMRERIRKSLLGSRVLILGVAYKKDVNDSRESPAFEVN